MPGPGAAVFLPSAALAATFVLAKVLLTPADLDRPWAAALQQGILLAAVLAGIGLAGLDPKATLGLRLPGPAHALAGLLLGIGAPLATPWLTRSAGLVPEESGAGEIVARLVGSLDPVPLVLLLGVLPAVAEEALFRGWCLRGFRSEMGAFAAIALSSVLFGAFHLEPDRIAFTAALGLGLGFLALRSASLCPAILAHALHNGITVGFAKSIADLPATTPPEALPFAARVLEGGSAGIGMIGVALAAAGIALAALAPRRDSLPPAPRAG
jgi:membrane protease YdiL (CAAX protease family)